MAFIIYRSYYFSRVLIPRISAIIYFNIIISQELKKWIVICLIDFNIHTLILEAIV